ncbi:MAG: hypothetical protein M3Y54_12765, partial [Bacteroidota bacterium]|nr:hypothetical protein [Bacteroidota bacterium]
ALASSTIGSLSAQSRFPGHAAGPPKVAAVEAHNETAAPSFSRQVRDAQRITLFLADALCLTTAQQLALQQHTVAQHTALLLATSDSDIQAAQLNYLAAVRRVLAASQLEAYVALRQKLAGTTLPIDGLELAVR